MKKQLFFVPLCIFALIIVLTVSFASVDSLFALTESELNNMPEEKVKVLPMLEVMLAIGTSEKEYYFILENILLDLRYYYKEPRGEFSQELEKAIELFQSDVGHKPNGIVTVEQFEILRKRHNLISGIEIYPSPVNKTITKVEGYLKANGTWVFENDTQAHPLQTSEIICSQYLKKCYMATARIASLFHDSDQASILVDIEEFNISKWTEREVQAENDNALCVSYTLSINPIKEEAFLFRRGKGGTGCKGIAESPQILRLVGGFKVGQEFWEKRRDERAKARSSTYQNLSKEFESQ